MVTVPDVAPPAYVTLDVLTLTVTVAAPSVRVLLNEVDEPVTLLEMVCSTPEGAVTVKLAVEDEKVFIAEVPVRRSALIVWVPVDNWFWSSVTP